MSQTHKDSHEITTSYEIIKRLRTALAPQGKHLHKYDVSYNPNNDTFSLIVSIDRTDKAASISKLLENVAQETALFSVAAKEYVSGSWASSYDYTDWGGGRGVNTGNNMTPIIEIDVPHNKLEALLAYTPELTRRIGELELPKLADLTGSLASQVSEQRIKPAQQQLATLLKQWQNALPNDGSSQAIATQAAMAALLTAPNMDITHATIDAIPMVKTFGGEAAATATNALTSLQTLLNEWHSSSVSIHHDISPALIQEQTAQLAKLGESLANDNKTTAKLFLQNLETARTEGKGKF